MKEVKKLPFLQEAAAAVWLCGEPGEGGGSLALSNFPAGVSSF